MNANHALSQLSYSPKYSHKDTLAEEISWLASFMLIEAGARKHIKICDKRTNEE